MNPLALLNPQLARWTRIEFCTYFLIVPAFLLILFILPQPVKVQYCILQIADPKFPNLFFFAYTHLAPFHLLGNLTSYFLVVFAIFNLERDKRLFHLSAAAIFFVFPLIDTCIELSLLPGSFIVQGFSGITAAFAGYLVIAVYHALRTDLRLPLTLSFVYMIVLFNLLLAAVFSLDAPPTFSLMIGAVFLISLFKNARHLNPAYLAFRNLLKDFNTHSFLFTGARVLLGAVILSYLFILPLLIPVDLHSQYGMVNILSHYLGYVFGVVVPLVTEAVPGRCDTGIM